MPHRRALKSCNAHLAMDYPLDISCICCLISLGLFYLFFLTDDTFTSTSESTGSTKDLRFFILGGDEDVMDRTCDIILRKRAKRAESETRHRKGHVCGRKISVVKTPSTWMSDVASCCCFSSRVKSIKDQMPDYASLVFPGPHAFLLVTDNREVTWREQYLLKAIAKVFSKEALDYAMLLIIGKRTKRDRLCQEVREKGLYIGGQ